MKKQACMYELHKGDIYSDIDLNMYVRQTWKYARCNFNSV